MPTTFVLGVVKGVVLEPPDPRAGPHEVGAAGDETVGPGRPAERAVVGVVHDPGAGRRHGDRQREGTHEPDDRHPVDEHETAIAGHGQGDDHTRFGVQATAGAGDRRVGRPDGPGQGDDQFTPIVVVVARAPNVDGAGVGWSGTSGSLILAPVIA